MTRLDLSKLDALFEDENVRRALFLAGCVAAASAFGHAAPILAQTISQGASHAHLAFPTLPPAAVDAHYFSGVLGFFSSAAEFGAEKLAALGHAVPAAMGDALDQPRDFIASNFTHARTAFSEAARRSSDLATGCVGLLREGAGHAENLGRSLLDMIPTDPSEAAKFFGGLVKKATEAFGVAHGCYKAFSWIGRKIRRKAPPETAPQVVNIQVNIALGQSGEEIGEAAVSADRFERMRRIAKTAPFTPPRSTEKPLAREVIAFLQKQGVRKTNHYDTAPAV